MATGHRTDDSREDGVAQRTHDRRWVVGRATGLLIGFTWLVFLTGAESSAWGQRRAAVAPAQDEYLGRKIAPTMHFTGAEWLVRESRNREEDCRTMLEQLRVQPGQTICDMGCGNGFYTLQLAELVGDTGKILAVDIQPQMLRILQARAAENQLKNVELILGTEDDPKLPQGKVDVILCVDVYHEFSKPAEMLKAMRQSLKPDGVVVLVEFREEDPEVPILPLHKMSKAQVRKELTANGFELVREFDGLPWQHMLFYRAARPDSPAAPPAGN
ncbi:MAG: class I SAM-dependent methyltransferase [Pirellulales bacterium]